jgi:ketosteroid isomerase-like protein
MKALYLAQVALCLLGSGPISAFQGDTQMSTEQLLTRFTNEAADPKLTSEQAVALMRSRVSDVLTRVSPVGVVSQVSRDEIAKEIEAPKNANKEGSVVASSRSDIKIRVEGNTAIVTYNEQISLSQTGPSKVNVTGSVAVLDVWIKTSSGEWRQISTQATPISPLSSTLPETQKSAVPTSN